MLKLYSDGKYNIKNSEIITLFEIKNVGVEC